MKINQLNTLNPDDYNPEEDSIIVHLENGETFKSTSSNIYDFHTGGSSGLISFLDAPFFLEEISGSQSGQSREFNLQGSGIPSEATSVLINCIDSFSEGGTSLRVFEIFHYLNQEKTKQARYYKNYTTNSAKSKNYPYQDTVQIWAPIINQKILIKFGQLTRVDIRIEVIAYS
jgi:hypothetical protein